jgi:hypothetical protein
MVGTHLLTLGHPVLRLRMVGPNLLPLSAPGLDVHPVPVRLLAFGTHLDVLGPLRTLLSKPLLTLHLGRSKSAAAMAATAAECLHPLTAAATAAECLSLLVTTATAATLRLCRAVLTAAAVAPRPRIGRGCDR